MRNKRLDILRAIAVVLVLGRHWNGPQFWYKIGWVGVDLFFVLSGYLISGLLFSEFKNAGRISWGRFFIRRGFKIYPSFYVMIFATFLWQVVKHSPLSWSPYWSELFFYQCYRPDRLWGHTWSLAVEEHFYIFLPLLLLIILKFRAKKSPSDPFQVIPVVCLILAIICLSQRTYLAYTAVHSWGWWQSIHFPTHLRMDSLFFGVFLGYLHHFHKATLEGVVATRWSRYTLLAGSALLVSTCAIFPSDTPFMLSFGFTCLYLGFGGILILVLYGYPEKANKSQSWLRRLTVGNLVAYVGMYSYSIYLWHPMVTQHVRGTIHLFWPSLGEKGIFWGYILTSVVVGIVFSKLIEYPVLHLRDRLFPAPRRRDKDPKREESIPRVLANVGLAADAGPAQKE